MSKVGIVPTDTDDVFGVAIRATKQLMMAATKDESIMELFIADLRSALIQQVKVFEKESK